MLSKIVFVNIIFMYFQNSEYGDFKRLWVNEKHIMAGEEYVVRRGFVLECITGKEKKLFLCWTLNVVFKYLHSRISWTTTYDTYIFSQLTVFFFSAYISTYREVQSILSQSSKATSFLQNLLPQFRGMPKVKHFIPKVSILEAGSAFVEQDRHMQESPEHSN